MRAPPGWYYAQGDPPGTVRRWDGEKWVGNPSQPPTADELELSRLSTVVSAPEPEPQVVAADEPVPSIHMPNESMIPLSACALLGLAAGIFTAASLAFELLDARSLSDGFPADTPVIVTALEDPFGHPSMIRLYVAIILGGLTFVGWLRWAYGPFTVFTGRGVAVSPWFIGWYIVSTVLRSIFGPVIRAMFGLLRRYRLSTVPAVVWWVLWMISAYGFCLGLLFNRSEGVVRGSIMMFVVLLVLHIVALLLAAAFVVAITIRHESHRSTTATAPPV